MGAPSLETALERIVLGVSSLDAARAVMGDKANVGVWSMGNTGLRDGYFSAKPKATPEMSAGSRTLHLDGVQEAPFRDGFASTT